MRLAAGLCPETLGELTALPQSLAELGEGKGVEKREGQEGEGEGRGRGRRKGRIPPMFEVR